MFLHGDVSVGHLLEESIQTIWFIFCSPSKPTLDLNSGPRPQSEHDALDRLAMVPGSEFLIGKEPSQSFFIWWNQVADIVIYNLIYCCTAHSNKHSIITGKHNPQQYRN